MLKFAAKHTITVFRADPTYQMCRHLLVCLLAYVKKHYFKDKGETSKKEAHG